MNNGEINIYVKDTNSGLCTNYNSYEPWYTKTAWIRVLYDRTYEICRNNNLLHKEVARIKKILSRNGYLGYIRNKVIKRLENKKNTKNTDTLEQENISLTFCRVTRNR